MQNHESTAPPYAPFEPPLDLARYAKLLAALAIALAICFALPLYHLVRMAADSDLYSYILLVPFISVYLGWLRRDKLVAGGFRPALFPACALGAIGLALLALYGASAALHWHWSQNDTLCVTTLSFVFLFLSGTVLLLGRQALRAWLLPMAFLLFMAPLPSLAEASLENFLQHTSAEAAYVMLRTAGTPVLRQGTVFQMPGITLEVAPECSGIHSSVVLFMTALVAGYLFLRRPWSRLALVLCVIPLGILRNGFRIFTLSQLCVYVNRDFIDSPLHHRGGPIFFVISLVPFFLLLWLLRKLDRRQPSSESN